MKLADVRFIEGRDPETIRPEIPKPLGSEKAAKAEKGERCYYVLTARQCQALAAANAVWGNILDEESELAAAVVGRGRTPRARSAALQSDLLRYSALSERNRAAADALELFYRLAEAESHWDLCQSALEWMEKAEGKKDGSEATVSSASGNAEEKDEKTPERRSQSSSENVLSERWAAQRERWQRRQEEAEQRIEKINSRLRPMLGGELGDFRRIWPSAALAVSPQKIDVEKAVQHGLEERAELRALRRLLRGIDANDLSAVRHTLEQWHPALGSTPSRFPALAQALGTAPQHMEAATREEQIRFLLSRREKEVEEEIRQAARQAQTALEELVQTHQAYLATREVQGKRDARSSDQKESGSAREENDSQKAAPLAYYEAQAELVSRVVAWKIAEVRLLEAVGVLARESGYPLPEDAWQGIEP